MGLAVNPPPLERPDGGAGSRRYTASRNFRADHQTYFARDPRDAAAEAPRAQGAPEPRPNEATAREAGGSPFEECPCRHEHRLFGFADGLGGEHDQWRFVVELRIGRP
jgi:hypothetical protein